MRLSVVVLTCNEEPNIGGCLQALACQSEQDIEVIVIDAGSQDRTCDVVRAMQADYPIPLHLEPVPYRIPIGDARNLGVELARTEHVAYLSADAEPDADWAAHAIAGLRDHAMVFGRQVHAPHRWTTAAAVRGLRYHFPAGPSNDPIRYASNVSAAYQKSVLQAFPFDPAANASEDVLLARRATAAGHAATYDPDMVVYHHDVHAFHEEMRKNVREGYACGEHIDELGADSLVMGWGAAMLTSAALIAVRPRMMSFATVALLWAPAVRRVIRHRHDMPPRRMLTGAAVSPVYDLAFLIQYLRGMTRPRKETHP